MNLAATLELACGGPGSGCQGPNCGRPAADGHSGDKEAAETGHCHSFALAMHNKTGWSMFGIQRPKDSWPGEHIVVKSPKGFIDANGRNAVVRWTNKHGEGNLVPVSAEDVKKGLPGFMKAFPEKFSGLVNDTLRKLS